PFEQRIVQNLKQPPRFNHLRIIHIVINPAQPGDQLLLIADPDLSLDNVGIGLEKKSPLSIKLLQNPGTIGGAHCKPSHISSGRSGGSSERSTTRRIMSACSRYSAARFSY